MVRTSGAPVASGLAFVQPAPMTRLTPVSAGLAQPPVRGAAAPTATSMRATATAAGVAAAAGAVVGAGQKRRRAAGKAPKVNLQQPSSAPTVEINYYELDDVDAPKIMAMVKEGILMAAQIVEDSSAPEERLIKLLSEKSVISMLTSISRLPVFSYEMGSAFKDNLDLLLALKQLKYFWSIPQSPSPGFPA